MSVNAMGKDKKIPQVLHLDLDLLINRHIRYLCASPIPAC